MRLHSTHCACGCTCVGVPTQVCVCVCVCVHACVYACVCVCVKEKIHAYTHVTVSNNDFIISWTDVNPKSSCTVHSHDSHDHITVMQHGLVGPGHGWEVHLKLGQSAHHTHLVNKK